MELIALVCFERVRIPFALTDSRYFDCDTLAQINSMIECEFNHGINLRECVAIKIARVRQGERYSNSFKTHKCN